MNLTQETNDYFSTTSTSGETNKIWMSFDGWKLEKDFASKANKMALDHWATYKNNISNSEIVDDDYCNANSNLKDKLKTTPSAGLTWLSKSFRINWNMS